jgi:hypothetical protein
MEDDYWENCKSPIADMTNMGGRFGGAITAAFFPQEYFDFEKVQAGIVLLLQQNLPHLSNFDQLM